MKTAAITPYAVAVQDFAAEVGLGALRAKLVELELDSVATVYHMDAAQKLDLSRCAESLADEAVVNSLDALWRIVQLFQGSIIFNITFREPLYAASLTWMPELRRWQGWTMTITAPSTGRSCGTSARLWASTPRRSWIKRLLSLNRRATEMAM